MTTGVKAGIRRTTRRAMSLAAVASLAGLSAQAYADTAEPDQKHKDHRTQVSEVMVKGKKEHLTSSKYTTELKDTPQTITVVSSETMAAQNLLSLREILTTQPGITFGAGEGGGGYGDKINLRGYSADNDITVDGVRDSAQYSRTDSFNIEQLEVVNGANSVYAGSGSIGGSINLVSKSAKGRDFIEGVAGLGTDGYQRVTLDANHHITPDIAGRINVMKHSNDVPGRNVESFDRWGVAGSVTFGMKSPTRVTLSYAHQTDENVPQYGIPYIRGAGLNGVLPGVNRKSYYGFANLDRQDSRVDSYTIKFEHDFNSHLSFRNLTRYAEVTQTTVVDPPQGTWCLDTGKTAEGVTCATPGKYLPAGPRGFTRHTRNTALYNQSDFSASFNTGPFSHKAVVGVSVSSEDYHLDSGFSLRDSAGNPVALPPMDIANPNPIYTGPVNYMKTLDREGTLKNAAIYAFDTISLTPQWDLNLGIRQEHSRSTYSSTTFALPYPATGPVGVAGPTFKNTADLTSYRAGLVYKPRPDLSLYLAYGNTQTPSTATVNAGCSATNCNVDPEKGQVTELGAKWSGFGERLLLTGSIFRNERTNYAVASGDPTQPNVVLDGSSRVDGVTLGASGKILPNWTVFANYTYLDSEVLKSVSNKVFADTGIDAQKGNPLTNTPEHSGSLWTTYSPFKGLELGYGITYVGDYYLNNSRVDSSGKPIPLYKMPSYTTHALMVSYAITQKTSVQLNVKNLTDETYLTRARAFPNSVGWATPGEGRSAVVTLNHKF